MKIYVGTYHKYNMGSSEGEWIDLNSLEFIFPTIQNIHGGKDFEKIFYNICHRIHSDEGSNPEFMFQDWERIPRGLISESEIDSRLFDILDLDLNEEEQQSFIDYMSNQNFHWDDIEEAYESYQDNYQGNYFNLQEFTDELFDEQVLSEIPEHIWNLISGNEVYEAYYHNVKHDYYILDNGDVFLNC